MHSSPQAPAAEDVWQWCKPSPWRFLRSLYDDAKDFLWGPWTRWNILAWVLIIVGVLTVYIYRYAILHPLYLNLRIYLLAVVGVMLVAAVGWYLVGKLAHRWLSDGSYRYVSPLGAVLAAWMVVMGGAAGKDLHGFFSQYWRYTTLETVEPKVDPLTDHERIWSLDGVYTFARRQMRDTETPSKPHLVRDGEQFVWTMGIEPTTWLLQYWEPVDEVVSIRSDIRSFELVRGRNAYFETGELLKFSRNIYTCTQRRLWFWDAFSHEITRDTLYLKNDAGKMVQVVPIIRWVGWVFPRPEFGGVVVVEQRQPLSWFGERLATLRRVFWGCGTWVGPDEVASQKYLVGQNIVPYEVTRYMAQSLRFRNGFWAPTWLRREGDIRIADMPDDQNEQPFTLFFHIRNDEGKIVASKLFQYVALEPYDPALQGHAAELLYPADGIGKKAYVYQFFGQRESLTGVSAVPGWVRSSKRNYDWPTNLPNEQRPYIRDIADSSGVVKTRRMWLTAVVTIDKQKYNSKDPKGFITGSPDIVITDAKYNRSVWVGDNPNTWPDQLRKELGPLWAEKP